MMRPILLIVLAILYALWPFDLVADLLPGWGWLDDAAILYLAWTIFRRMRRPRSFRSDSSAGNGAGNAQRTGPEEKSPFETLGISPDASAEEIARAYRTLAARYHPDKVQHLGEEFQKLAEERFKEIQAAYDDLKKHKRV